MSRVSGECLDGALRVSLTPSIEEETLAVAGQCCLTLAWRLRNESRVPSKKLLFIIAFGAC